MLLFSPSQPQEALSCATLGKWDFAPHPIKGLAPFEIPLIFLQQGTRKRVPFLFWV